MPYRGPHPYQGGWERAFHRGEPRTSRLPGTSVELESDLATERRIRLQRQRDAELSVGRERAARIQQLQDSRRLSEQEQAFRRLQAVYEPSPRPVVSEWTDFDDEIMEKPTRQGATITSAKMGLPRAFQGSPRGYQEMLQHRTPETHQTHDSRHRDTERRISARDEARQARSLEFRMNAERVVEPWWETEQQRSDRRQRMFDYYQQLKQNEIAREELLNEAERSGDEPEESLFL